MLTAELALALFVMLALSSISLFGAERLKIPHTVFLVIVGVALGVVAQFTPLHFLDDLAFTPELLFYIFLPILIFESAYNINIRHLTDDAPIISILSIVSLLVSAFLIACGIHSIFSLIGMPVPFIFSLLFGAIISATDPVAVLALFKEYGAPRRLSLIFEGESIFNDGTGVALFLVILAMAESAKFDIQAGVEGLLSFTVMVIGGIIFGLVFGGFFAKLIGRVRSNEFASITLTMVLAHSTFICAELFSEHVVIGGMEIRLSSIIATAVASLLMGNYGRYKIAPHAHEFVEKYWSQFAFIANSLIFIMIGMLATQLPAIDGALILPIFLVIVIVALARALSIYPIVTIFNYFSSKKMSLPISWQHVLAWGSLRGALAITMVLLIPDNLSFSGWSYPLTPKELILTLTVTCIFATLFIKATTIGYFMKKLRLSTFTAIEEINYREMLLYIYKQTIERLKKFHEKGYVNHEAYTKILAEERKKIDAISADIREYANDETMLFTVLRLHAIGIERKYIKSLYDADEVSEYVIKRIMAKLEFQSKAIEEAVANHESYEHGHTLDVFEYLAMKLSLFYRGRKSERELAIQEYQYYRALSIVSRKVIKELQNLSEAFRDEGHVVIQSIQKTIEIYTRYREGSTTKLDDLRLRYPDDMAVLDIALARFALYKSESDMLHDLKEREMITPKVFITLTKRFEEEKRAEQ